MESNSKSDSVERNSDSNSNSNYGNSNSIPIQILAIPIQFQFRSDWEKPIQFQFQFRNWNWNWQAIPIPDRNWPQLWAGLHRNRPQTKPAAYWRKRPPIGGSGRLLFPTAGAAGGARFVYTAAAVLYTHYTASTNYLPLMSSQFDWHCRPRLWLCYGCTASLLAIYVA